MSVRRKTTNRLRLYRECGTCGRMITTTADSPWMRQVPRDGKKQATTYYCSTKCFASSYKHIGWYDGKAEERRKEREAKRDVREKNRRYYQAHKEEICEKKKLKRLQNPGQSALDCAYQRHKRKLLMEERNETN